MRLSLTLLALLLLLAPAASRQLTAIRVSGGQDLQAALDAARPGDTLVLEPGAVFVGNFILPNHAGQAAFITIATDPAAGLPDPGVRTGPEYAGRLAVLQSPNGNPALRTAPGAHHWRVENLEFRANADGNGNIIALGDTAGAQRELAQVPHTLVLDRLYIHGDPIRGQKRGIALNSASTTITNSYISEIKGVGVETHAIAGWNGPGPYTITNNHLEAAGVNVMFGGADPGIPNLVPQGIEFRRNDLTKRLEWRDPIVAAPAGLRATAAVVGGTLRGGTYRYRVVGERSAGQAAAALSAASAPVETVLESTNSGVITVEWSPVAGATGYRVYRRGPDGVELFWRVSSPRFADDGNAGSAGSPPDTPSRWLVKNLIELKNARDVTIDGNRFEHNWLSGQAGYAVLFKPTNQDGQAPWVTVERVRFTNNVVRSVGSAINILGMDDRNETGRARGMVIVNNVFVDVSHVRWGGSGDFLQIGGGPAELVVEHNTVLHTGRVISAHGNARGRSVESFVFRNNLLRHNQYGVKGSEAATGTGTLTAYFPGAVFEGNVLAGGNPSHYPLGNFFPPLEELESQFVDAAAGNYRLRPDSPFRRAGAGGRDIGVDMDALERARHE